MKCDYCGKYISKKENYGVLGSGLITHNTDDDDDCYRKAFVTERYTLRGLWFNLRNSFLYQRFKLSFQWQFFKYFRLGLRDKRGKK